MVKIINDINSLNQADLDNRAAFVFKKMNGNALYNMFGEPVATLGTLSSAYTNALFQEDGSDAKRDVKNKTKDALKLFLTKFIKKIEVTANDLPTEDEAIAFAKGTGCTISEANNKKAAALTFLDAPTSFKVVDDDRPCAALLTWKRVVNALIYLIEELNKDGVWESRGTSTQPSVVIAGTASEVKRTFRIQASATDGLVSSYTDAVSVWVH